MRRYIDHAIIWDFLLAVIIGTCIFYGKPTLEMFFTLPKIENVNNFCISLITISATLMGFLLTIITVIVTFKRGFEDKPCVEPNDKLNDKLKLEMPDKTIFERNISKETKFYGTQIHKRVVDVFVNATYEIGMVLLILLIIQFNIFSHTIFCISVISFCLFIMIILSITRSLFIFKLFLNVHLHGKTLNQYS